MEKTGEYYASLLNRLKVAIADKHPGMAKKKMVLFHHDNAPAHSSRLAQQKLTELRFKLLPHPACSPDLASSNYHLLPKLKTFLIGQKFGSIEEVM